MSIKRFFGSLSLALIATFLLSPSSFAAEQDPVQDWMAMIESQYLHQQYIDMDGAYNGQCVDLAFFYADELFKAQGFRQTIGLGNANQLLYSASDKYFQAIPYTGEPPQVGDLILWDHWAGGHVGVVFEVQAGTVRYYEQNTNGYGTSPVGIGETTTDSCALPYLSDHPIGYLRPKLTPSKLQPILEFHMLEQTD